MCPSPMPFADLRPFFPEAVFSMRRARARQDSAAQESRKEMRYTWFTLPLKDVTSGGTE